MILNSQFISDYLTRYEEHNLKSYNSGGYAYETVRLQNSEGQIKSSLIDEILNKGPSLEEAQRRATEVQLNDDDAYMKVES